jgi:hypothetical protein
MESRLLHAEKGGSGAVCSNCTTTKKVAGPNEIAPAGVNFLSQPHPLRRERSSGFPAVGTWLSLVEHSLGVRGVGSSNLPVPTIVHFVPDQIEWLCKGQRLTPSVAQFKSTDLSSSPRSAEFLVTKCAIAAVRTYRIFSSLHGSWVGQKRAVLAHHELRSPAISFQQPSVLPF